MDAVGDGADELISLFPALVLAGPPPYAVVFVVPSSPPRASEEGEVVVRCKSGGVGRGKGMCRRQAVWGGEGAVRGAAMAGLASISAGRHGLGAELDMRHGLRLNPRIPGKQSAISSVSVTQAHPNQIHCAMAVTVL